MADSGLLPGGGDSGAERDGDVIIRTARPWTQSYGWEGPPSGVLKTMDRVVAQQIDVLRSRAAGGDSTYERMLELGWHLDLEAARREIEQVIEKDP